MSIENSLKLELENMVKGIAGIHEICDRNSKNIQAIDEEQIVKLNDSVTKSMDAINELKSRNQKIDDAVKNLETIAARPANGKAQDEGLMEQKTAFLNFLRKGTPPSLDVQTQIAAKYAKKMCIGGSDTDIEIIKKSLVEGINPDGGYWIRPEMSDRVISRIFETSPMRGISSSMNISGESVQLIVDDNEAEAEWVGEVDLRPETANPQIGLKEIFAHELMANMPASQRILDDVSFDLETWIMGKISDRFTRKENTSFVVGNGSKKSRGFLTYPAWANVEVYEREKIAQLNSGSNGLFDGDNLIDLQNLLLEGYQANATWVMKRVTFGTVIKLKDMEGQYLLNPNVIAQGADRILLGKPVVFFDDMPAIATDALAIAYGDFRVGYTIIDRIGIRMLRDPFTKKPFVLFYATKRVGGDVTNYQSIKILKLAV